MGSSQSTPPAEKIDFNRNSIRKNVIVIPVDQSKQSEAAFMWYVNHGHQPGNQVQIVHCQEWPPHTTFDNPETANESFKRARTESRTLIEEYQKKLAKYNVPGSVHFEFGSPGESVVNASERCHATQIVMGTRGFGMIRRTILGSVSEYVVHHSKVPVTVVPKETQSWFF